MKRKGNLNGNSNVNMNLCKTLAFLVTSLLVVQCLIFSTNVLLFNYKSDAVFLIKVAYYSFSKT